MKRFITSIMLLSITTLIIVSCAAGVQDTGATTTTSNSSNGTVYNSSEYNALDPKTSTLANTTSGSTTSLSAIFLSSLASNADSILSSIISVSKKVASESKDGGGCSNGQCCGGGTCGVKGGGQKVSVNNNDNQMLGVNKDGTTRGLTYEETQQEAKKLQDEKDQQLQKMDIDEYNSELFDYIKNDRRDI